MFVYLHFPTFELNVALMNNKYYLRALFANCWWAKNIYKKKIVWSRRIVINSEIHSMLTQCCREFTLWKYQWTRMHCSSILQPRINYTFRYYETKLFGTARDLLTMIYRMQCHTAGGWFFLSEENARFSS